MSCEGLLEPKTSEAMLLAGELGSVGKTLEHSLVTWSVNAVWTRLDIVFRMIVKGSLQQDLHSFIFYKATHAYSLC